ncbi:DUF1501 domain-containing protein [Jejudonia soesokkakensis]|uniref:DUF1501 domain-containing protein n=1 Tax=Jejudonia soesokkakensis TaxID=1323432 RepID=A0ABW2MSU5_9FLAO
MCQHHFSGKKASKEEKQIHDKEHASWNRRSFIQALGLTGVGSVMLGATQISASKPSPLSVALSNSENDNILVIVRFKGGNDGLNTIVPVYDYDSYANLRPTIKHAQNDLINLDANFGIPNYMTGLESLWGNGQMKVVHGVGYQNQNLSHFRSSEIWASAEPVDFVSTGWWGRYFEDLYPDYIISPPEVPPAIQIGSIGNLIFEGTDNNYAFSVANPEQLANVAQNGTQHDVLDIPDCVYGDKLLFMRATANTTYQYAGVINEAYSSAVNAVDYGEGELANQLAIVARMIKGGLGTKVYMVTLNGFDTHANQVNDHRTLLEDVSNSMKNFYDDLSAIGIQNKVLSMSISEFGRRPYENGSNGTDHGAASPVLLFGPGLEGSGFVGEHPDINTWDANDNLIPSTDFRDVYQTVLTNWFCLENSVVNGILLNQTFENLNLGLDCNNLSVNDFSNTTQIKHTPFYQNDNTFIELTMPVTAHVDMRLYNVLGKEIGSLKNEILFAGKHTIDVKASIRNSLSYGQYIYRLSIGGVFYSKSIIIK